MLTRREAALPRGHGLRGAGAGRPDGRGRPARPAAARPTVATAAASSAIAVNPLAAQGRRSSPAKAKRVIHLFMNGGPSHVDTFDPKPC